MTDRMQLAHADKPAQATAHADKPTQVTTLAGKSREVRTEPSRRLVVELGRRTAADLAWLVEEEDVNKTTAVNRAVQVYRLLVEAQNNGGTITVSDPARGDSTMHIVT